jgi:hypothetical protein
MSKLEVTCTNAIEAHKSADTNGKKLLEKLFPKQNFNQKIIDRVKTFEDACEILGKDPVKVLPCKNPSEDFEIAMNAIAMIFIIIEAINEDWRADFSNTNQSKYYPWFEQKSGFGLSFLGYVNWLTDTLCGVRFACETSDKAKYVGTQFLHIYNQFLIYNK